MIAMDSADVENVQVGTLPYKGETKDAKQVSVRWLSRVGQDAQGSPAYGLRLFTVGPLRSVSSSVRIYLQRYRDLKSSRDSPPGTMQQPLFPQPQCPGPDYR